MKKIYRKTKRLFRKIKRVLRKTSTYIDNSPYLPFKIRPTRKASAILFIVILAIIGYQNTLGVKDTAVSYKTNESSSSIRCIDGDTFALGSEKIRLLAIDTPETVAPGKSVEPFGPEASELTCKLLQEAELLELKYDEGNEIDKYDRKLLWVYIDGELLQDVLVKEGYAEIKYVDNKTVDKKILNSLEKSQKDAQLHQRGIWSK